MPARPASPSGRAFCTRLPDHAGWGAGPSFVVYLRPRPRGGRGPRGRRARLPSPSPPSSPASLYPTSGFPRWLGSAAAAQEPFWTRFSSPPPHPSPRSWPLRTRPLCPGPGPSPAARCLSRARPGPRPAAAPRPPRRPGARAEACAARSGPEPGPAVRPLEPARCRERRRRNRAGNEAEGAGRRAQPPPGPARPGSAARPCPRAPGVRGAAPRNMTAPWAALALLWGSLCAGKNEARRGGRRKGARSGFGRRAVFTNKGRARGLLAAPPAPSLHLPGRGQGARRAPRSLVLEGGGDLACAAACGAPVRGGDPRVGVLAIWARGT